MKITKEMKERHQAELTKMRGYVETIAEELSIMSKRRKG